MQSAKGRQSSGFARWAFLCLPLWCPADFLLPGRCPEPAPLSKVLALLQLLLADVAAKKRVAVLVNAVCEVLADQAMDSSAVQPP